MAKNRLDYEANLGRHSHDVHAGFTSQLTPGPIVPQYFDILGPGDSIYYKTHMFARFQPLVTAFLGEVDVHIDYFFVPLQMLYLPFGSMFANTNDILSSVFKTYGTTPYSVPLLDIMETLDSSNTDVHGFFEGHQECLGKEVARLFDALDLNPFVVLADSSIGGDSRPDASIPDNMCQVPVCCPWALYAYQAVYQNYYRNDEFETFNVQAYNIDQYFNSVSFSNLEAVKLRYIQRPSDYFTNIRVSPIYSAVNSFGQSWQTSGLFPENGGDPKGRGNNTLFTALNWLGAGGPEIRNFAQKFEGGYTVGTDSDTAVDSFSFVGTTQNFDSNDPDSTFINASNIRALFALDKYQRIFGRAKKTYDDQILAHFGIKIPHDVKHDITHLKHYRMVLQADTVVANSAYEDLKLGQIGGQGSAVIDTDGEKFTAPVHGVFLAVAYAVTKPRYQETFSKLHLLSNAISFPQPEFDKLGAQPMFMYEFMPSALSVLPNNPYRVGWQNRYQEFKQKYNRASISYMGTNTQYGSKINNVYAPWVLSQQPFFDYGFSGTPTYEDHFINPTVLFESPHSLDNVMVTPYNGYWTNAWLSNPHLMFQTDPIITDFMCSAKKVSWMSPTGEPDL